MNRYTVVWVKSAQDELAELWLNASDRNAVTAAAREIDLMLAVDAERKDDEVSEGLIGLRVPPLRALFAVREDDRIVEVLAVRCI